MRAGATDYQSWNSWRITLGSSGGERDVDPFGESGINPMTGSEANPEHEAPSLFDLKRLAKNGLRRGYTTGTCATAAVKAALLKLVCHETPPEVRVTLPDSLQYLAEIGRASCRERVCLAV